MGSCVSLNRGSESAVKLRLGSGKEKLAIPSPVKGAVSDGDRAAPGVAPPKPQFSSVRFAGSKDEAFFDSQPWLESDCEDDYYSVNGDFTPSRGSTPVHHSFASARVDNSAVVEQKIDSPPDDSSSPTGQKRRLSELFQDSLRIVADQPPIERNENDSNVLLPTKPEDQSANGTRNDPNQKIVNGDDDCKDKSAQCCAPGLLRNRSLSGRKKKATSPVDRNVG